MSTIENANFMSVLCVCLFSPEQEDETPSYFYDNFAGASINLVSSKFVNDGISLKFLSVVWDISIIISYR